MVTATQIASYVYCPRKLFITSVLLVKEPEKAELVKGTIWHNTYEFINDSEERIVKSINTDKHKDIFDIYRKEYAKFLRNAIIKHKAKLGKFSISLIDVFNDYWPHFEEQARLRSKNLAEFIKSHNIYGDELWEQLTPKILSEQYFQSKRLGLSGVIDVLEVHNGNLFVPIELKTGKAPQEGVWDTHRIQLAVYVMLLEDAGKQVSKAYVRYKGLEQRPVIINTIFKEEIVGLISKIDRLLGSLDIPDIIETKSKCAVCPLRETCYDPQAISKLLDEAKRRTAV